MPHFVTTEIANEDRGKRIYYRRVYDSLQTATRNIVNIFQTKTHLYLANMMKS